MVKIVLAILLFFNFLHAEVDEENDNQVLQKVQTFIDQNRYNANEEFIKIIFSPASNFYENDRVDVVKIVDTLKKNGLLKLFFDKPQELKLDFVSSGSPLFFLKVMRDSLRNIGYYRYVTVASHLNNLEFSWSITLLAEYATDPTLLQKELQKSGCKIVDIQRKSPTEWSYVVDTTQGYLNIEKLEASQEMKLNRSLYAHWLDVSNIKFLKIVSSYRNRWYPEISYYDSSLHLLKEVKSDKETSYINLKMPKNARYIKIADLYTLKNVKDALTLTPYGAK